MCYRSKRNEIHACGCDCCQSNWIRANAPRSFDQHFWGRTTYKLYCAAHSFYRHVVKQNHIGFCLNCLPNFHQCLTLHLDFEQVGSLVTCKHNCLRDATSGFDMVIFDQYTITEVVTVICPPPSRTASFSKLRRPGVVLRVSRIRASVPSSARTH